MTKTCAVLAATALVLAVGPALAFDALRPTDPTRYFTPNEEFEGSLPRDIHGRYPRPSALGNDVSVPVGAYLPVPPNLYMQRRAYGLGEAAVESRAVRKGYASSDAKGYAREDRRPANAWSGERGGRRSLVD